MEPTARKLTIFILNRKIIFCVIVRHLKKFFIYFNFKRRIFLLKYFEFINKDLSKNIF